jgi:hypothetical protein
MSFDLLTSSVATEANAWAASTAYAKGARVTNPLGVRFDCAVAHTSSSLFGTDLAAGNWVRVDGIQAPNSTNPQGRFDMANCRYNWRANNTLKIRGLVASARSSIKRIHIYGDSTSVGQGSGSEYRLGSTAERMKTLLASLVPSLTVGEGIIWFNQDSTDTRITLGSGWTNGTQGGAGLFSYGMGISNTTGLLSVTVPACDSVNVYYARISGSGTIGISIDGGTEVTQATTGTGTAVKTITGLANTTHTVAIRAVSTPVYPIGVEPVSGTAGLLVSRASRGGTKISDLIGNTQPYNSYACAFTMRPPDLAFLDFGINDYGGQVSLSQYNADLTTAVTALKTNGSDVVLVVPNRPNTTNTISFLTYVGQIYAVADAQDVPVIDITARWGGNSSTSAPSGFYFDNLHASAAGYWDIAEAYVRALLV